MIFDSYVNSGSYVGWMAQKALGNNPALSKSIPFKSDTVQVINSQNPQKFFEGFKDARVEFFKRIGTGSQAGFLSGWLRRVNDFDYSGVVDTVKKNPIKSGVALFAFVLVVGLIAYLAWTSKK